MTVQSEFKYKTYVENILALPFENLTSHELQQVWYLSWVAAVEFGEALRLSQKMYPDHAGLQEMILGELDTTNLALEDFQEPKDHHEFLSHFLIKHGVMEKMEAELGEHAATYLAACRALDPHTRAMTVFSREEELAGIFARFLDSAEENWEAPGLYAFKHYLTTHIVLDSSEGGHHELTNDFPIDDAVSPFYEARFESFRLVPSLAASGAYDAV
ncbi:hypothetical protein [Kitasatospora sp. MAP5-34]|uniref:hypothetical protein n=1 Tax=Kitasatospora sp. MAP5-34 TaxID=3035102 RepID=UPI002476140E|nr:hypothetical protein [Kitasatospora sp. MAP5-34]MDH6576654.1 hypothetical protein [Kitasatospora sp. MAP5-34]